MESNFNYNDKGEPYGYQISINHATKKLNYRVNIKNYLFISYCEFHGSEETCYYIR